MKKTIKVLKFGGTSMGSAEAMERVIDIVRRSQKDARIAAVVVSAMSGVTDELIKTATLAANKDESYQEHLAGIEKRHLEAVRALVGPKGRAAAEEEVKTLVGYLAKVVTGIRLVRELSPGALDYIMSYGERLSAHILASALADRGVSCEYLNARLVVKTDSNFGEAGVDFAVTDKAIRDHFKAHPKLQVVTGFIASTPDRKTTTLGRGGSDYTASIFGAALGASVIEIWTDVPGVMTADPRKVKDARPLSSMTYQEAIELSYFGAKVIHPPTMLPAQKKRIPIRIKNTFEPEAPGTVIGARAGAGGAVKGITSIGSVAMLRVEGAGLARVKGAAGRVFAALSRAKVGVLLSTQASSQHSLSFAVASRDTARAREALEEEFALERAARLVEPVAVREGLAILAVVGEGMAHTRGVAGKLFQTFAHAGVNVAAVAQGSSELNISVAIDGSDQARALNAVHAAFVSDLAPLNVFLVGTGVVGGALLGQMAAQQGFLERRHGVRLRLAGLADAAGIVLDAGGMMPGEGMARLRSSGEKADAAAFIARMREMALPGSVFVDCTASGDIAAAYPQVLSAGISVVTPNKIANSGPLVRYRKLREAAAEGGAVFLYETNVGAGLPVIGTLRDLVLSGDTIERIEGVFSGTLSYLFGAFDGTRPFSEIVKEARTRGYAEPDPRNDLSGADVARKALILARECGHDLELSDVRAENLLAPRCRKAANVEDFFRLLASQDDAFEKKRLAAAKEGKVLRYLAAVEKGKAAVGLRAVGPDHPSYGLGGADNVVAFFTARYRESPLVVRGPGAGAEVTAAGVFADILRTVRRGV